MGYAAGRIVGGKYVRFASPSEKSVSLTPGKVERQSALDHPKFAEYKKHHEEYAHSSTGMETGELCTYNGTPAKVLHEERHNDGTVRQIIQVSDATGSGTRELTWSPESEKTMRISGSRRIFS